MVKIAEHAGLLALQECDDDVHASVPAAPAGLRAGRASELERFHIGGVPAVFSQVWAPHSRPRSRVVNQLRALSRDSPRSGLPILVVNESGAVSSCCKLPQKSHVYHLSIVPCVFCCRFGNVSLE